MHLNHAEWLLFASFRPLRRHGASKYRRLAVAAKRHAELRYSLPSGTIHHNGVYHHVTQLKPHSKMTPEHAAAFLASRGDASWMPTAPPHQATSTPARVNATAAVDPTTPATTQATQQPAAGTAKCPYTYNDRHHDSQHVVYNQQVYHAQHDHDVS